jgi:hypothetical protein
MKKLTRGGFLRLSAMTGAGMVAAACAQPTPVVIEKEVIKEVQVEMGGELVSNAATAVFSQLALYVMAVAEKYGRQEAFDLLASSFNQYGTQIGSMVKQQLEGREANAQDIFGVLGPGNQSVGFEVEEVDSAPEKVTFNIRRCPLYEGCQAMGAPDQEFCNNLGLPFMNGVAKTMNPNAEYTIVRRRTSADGHCVEEITI